MSFTRTQLPRTLHTATRSAPALRTALPAASFSSFAPRRAQDKSSVDEKKPIPGFAGPAEERGQALKDAAGTVVEGVKSTLGINKDNEKLLDSRDEQDKEMDQGKKSGTMKRDKVGAKQENSN